MARASSRSRPTVRPPMITQLRRVQLPHCRLPSPRPVHPLRREVREQGCHLGRWPCLARRRPRFQRQNDAHRMRPPNSAARPRLCPALGFRPQRALHPAMHLRAHAESRRELFRPKHLRRTCRDAIREACRSLLRRKCPHDRGARAATHGCLRRRYRRRGRCWQAPMRAHPRLRRRPISIRKAQPLPCATVDRPPRGLPMGGTRLRCGRIRRS